MPTLPSSEMLKRITESRTVAINDKARLLRQQGRDVINLGGGEPDFHTPGHIVGSAYAAMKSGMTHYVNSPGIPELRKAISVKLHAEDKAQYDASQIIVTPGAKIALYLSLKTIINPGDEVIILNPAWVSYEPLISMVGGIAVPVHLDPEDNFRLAGHLIDEACGERTRAIIVNSPNNPTGRVLTEKEISELGQVAVERNLIIISDEVYDKLVYGNNRFISIAGLSDLVNRTITIKSFSKVYAMTGWRLGYLALPDELVESALKVQQHLMTCTASFIQLAGIAALTGPQNSIVEMKDVYEKRMIKVVESLDAISGTRCVMPEGAFYVFPEIAFRGYTSFQLADYLLERAGVAVTPGEAFGSQYTRHVRISCAEADDLLSAAMVRIANTLQS